MIVRKYPKLLFLFNRDDENVSKCSVLSNWLRKSIVSMIPLKLDNLPPNYASNDDEVTYN